MKKFIPVISILALTSLFVCSGSTSKSNNHNDFSQDVESFSNAIKVSNLESIQNTKTIMDKYNLKLNIPNDATLVDSDLEPIVEDNISSNDTTEQIIDPNFTLDSEPISTPEDEIVLEEENENEYLENENLENTMDENENNEDIDEKMLTIYSLSNDIDQNCDKYCEIKNLLTESILETQSLIEQIKTQQIKLNAEQRLLLNEQSNELKNLGQELSRNTKELNIYLKDVDGILTSENNDLDSVCLKYLLLLNNLHEGENLMSHGLASLGMMNNIMRMNSQILPENNYGKILYGFQKNDESPVIKKYDIDSNGNIIENESKNKDSSTIEQVNGKVDENENQIDSYKKRKLKANIDTYKNNYNNIDSFFNTALLDNEFMFGNGGIYNNAGFYPMMYGNNNYNSHNNFNPNINNTNYPNHQNNSTYSVNNDNNTQYGQANTKKDKKKNNIKLKKNVDTYRDDNTLKPKEKFRNLKAKIAGFFSKSTNNEKLNNLKK